ncbi:ERG4/ERG24 ergosterol biosynthesis protein [Pluteus cervinus]|uniref:ERG4/ERG24 ergosterol biosynthesis protein n=1 Tax=Pluteus cervinus TaxID=181527 RepID=A0ACD3B708_9AGAR|nr:ERG4/ERG24 ergosterol biosynthesis protein [Pluteus cervinus]
MSSKDQKQELNPRTKSFEFLGPPGATLITIGVPSMIYTLYFACSEASGGCPAPGLFSDPSALLERVSSALSSPEWWASLWDTEATIIYFAWYAFCIVAWAILPGDWVEGTTLRTGGKQKYKINAFSTYFLTLGLVTGWILRFGPESFTFIYEKWLGFVTASLLNSVIQAVYSYASSYRSGALLALGGNSGNFIYDFYIGRELNPTIGSLDLKSFNELRPGLILWVLVDISMVCEQAVRRGGLNHVTDSIWLVLAFHAWYVGDGIYNEPALFTTMDITTDGFGWMLSVGDLAWVPFVYSLQARYLAFKQVELGPVWATAIFLTNATGYYIFRTANNEKDHFRNGKNPKNLKSMDTKRGTKLLISGWWGLCQHPNYLGDLLMGLSWSLPTGFNTPITYFYVTYFLVLLAHRQTRDDEACEKKYGEDWKKYKKLVPYRIFPYIY